MSCLQNVRLTNIFICKSRICTCQRQYRSTGRLPLLRYDVHYCGLCCSCLRQQQTAVYPSIFPLDTWTPLAPSDMQVRLWPPPAQTLFICIAAFRQKVKKGHWCQTPCQSNSLDQVRPSLTWMTLMEAMHWMNAYSSALYWLLDTHCVTISHQSIPDFYICIKYIYLCFDFENKELQEDQKHIFILVIK